MRADQKRAAVIVVLMLMVGATLTAIDYARGKQADAFQDYCRSRLYDLRDDVADGKPFVQFVIEFTEYIDQCVEKRR